MADGTAEADGVGGGGIGDGEDWKWNKMVLGRFGAFGGWFVPRPTGL